MYGVIYMVINLINGKKYIGQTTKLLQNRKKNHIRWAINEYDNTHFHNAIRKHGYKNFKWEVIDTAINANCLNKKEIYWIDYYNTFNSNQYNSSIGGDLREFTDEVKNKISKSMKDRYEKSGGFTEEHKNNISKALKGKSLHLTKEQLENKADMMKLYHKKNPNHHKNTTYHSGSANHKSKKIICTTTGEVYENAYEASKILNINRASINKACNGKQKRAGELEWAFI